MSVPSAAQTIRIEDPLPLGDVTIAPSHMTGRSETELARAMADLLRPTGQKSAAETLRELRQSFPQMPLALRVEALRWR